MRFHVMNHNLSGKLLALLALTASAGGQPSGKQTLSPGGCFHTSRNGHLADRMD